MSTAHAKLSPSSAYRWMRCAGSVVACEGLPDEDSVYSREGTFGHDIAARCLREGVPAWTYIGTQSETGEFTLDAEFANHIQTYLDVVHEYDFLGGTTELFVEFPVKLTENVYGTLDAAVLSGRVLHVFDLKLGAGKSVGAEGNPQLGIYAAALLWTLPQDVRATLDSVELHIVQPRRPNADGNAHSQASMSRLELRDFVGHVLEAEQQVQRVTKPLAPHLTAGPWCDFCKARYTCEALQSKAMTAATEIFQSAELVPTPHPNLANIPPERIATILRAADAVESWIDAVRDHAYREAVAGRVPPGFKLVAKIGNRRWIDEADAATTLQREGIADPFEHTLISPAQAEKKSKHLKTIISHLTMRPDNGTALVPETDKRPAISVLPSTSVFTPIE